MVVEPPGFENILVEWDIPSFRLFALEQLLEDQNTAVALEAGYIQVWESCVVVVVVVVVVVEEEEEPVVVGQRTDGEPSIEEDRSCPELSVTGYCTAGLLTELGLV